jgi:hypothetical protein
MWWSGRRQQGSVHCVQVEHLNFFQLTVAANNWSGWREMKSHIRTKRQEWEEARSLRGNGLWYYYHRTISAVHCGEGQRDSPHPAPPGSTPAPVLIHDATNWLRSPWMVRVACWRGRVGCWSFRDVTRMVPIETSTSLLRGLRELQPVMGEKDGLKDTELEDVFSWNS